MTTLAVTTSLLLTTTRLSRPCRAFQTVVVPATVKLGSTPSLPKEKGKRDLSKQYPSSSSSLLTRRREQQTLAMIRHRDHNQHPLSLEKIHRAHHPSSSSNNNNILLSRLFSSSSSTDGSSRRTGGDRSFLLDDKILKFRGTVATGYGRGGKKLGVPTANLPSSLFQNALKDVPTGVYFGWATIEEENPSTSTVTVNASERKIHKAVVNVGYSPTFEGQENKEKIIEAHLISDNRLEQKKDRGDDTSSDDDVSPSSSPPPDKDTTTMDDFYGHPMRLQLIGYIRPERKFDNFDELITQINRDIDDAATLLDEQPYNKCKQDPFLVAKASSSSWIGKSGGDDKGSWEFTPIESFFDSLS